MARKNDVVCFSLSVLAARHTWLVPYIMPTPVSAPYVPDRDGNVLFLGQMMATHA